MSGDKGSVGDDVKEGVNTLCFAVIDLCDQMANHSSPPSQGECECQFDLIASFERVRCLDGFEMVE